MAKYRDGKGRFTSRKPRMRGLDGRYVSRKEEIRQEMIDRSLTVVAVVMTIVFLIVFGTAIMAAVR